VLAVGPLRPVALAIDPRQLVAVAPTRGNPGGFVATRALCAAFATNSPAGRPVDHRV